MSNPDTNRAAATRPAGCTATTDQDRNVPEVDLMSPLILRGVTLRNRIGVSPMCQYSAENGMASDWHLVHLGSRAVGGAGIVIVEATAVTPEGRITPGDVGIWDAAYAEPLARIARFVQGQGAVAGIQLAHAGRKASCDLPWQGGRRLRTAAEGAWPVVAPSPIPFRDDDPVPHELDEAGIDGIVRAFVEAARRALEAGFRVIELHAAHGYLLHSFLSPLSNRRSDRYGGSLENRMRLPVRLATEVRRLLPADVPLLVRISATDWADGGWDLPQSIELARALCAAGVDLIDCSSGGLVPRATIPVGRNYQVPFAAAIRKETGIATAAVGLITEAAQANEIITSGAADMVFIARQMLRDPYWAIHAQESLHQEPAWPVPYGYAVRRRH